MQEIKYKEYREPQKKADTLNIGFNLNGLKPRDLDLLTVLSEVVKRIDSIYRDQISQGTQQTIDFLDNLQIHTNEADSAQKINDYKTIIRMFNSVYDPISGKNVIFPLKKEELSVIISKTNSKALRNEFHRVEKFLYGNLKQPDGANLYPEDITDSELDESGIEDRVNSRIIRARNGKLKQVINETHYQKSLSEVIDLLTEARNLATESSLKKYISQKIIELQTGEKQAITDATIAMLKNNSKIGLIISTAGDNYSDGIKGVRGVAEAMVYINKGNIISGIDRSGLQEICNSLTGRSIQIPKQNLQFVDVVNQSGEYAAYPLFVYAETFPNEQELIKDHGTLSLIYDNVFSQLFAHIDRKEFEALLPEEIIQKHGDSFYPATLNLMAYHELGHGIKFADVKLKGKHVSMFDEGSVDLFGLLSIEHNASRAPDSAEFLEAAQYAFLKNLLYSVSELPVQDHIRAGNIIFHYFLRNKAIKPKSVGGKEEYYVNRDVFSKTAKKMFFEILDILSTGDLAKVKKFNTEYCYTDERRRSLVERISVTPDCTGLIFPYRWKGATPNDRLLVWNGEFSDQKRFSYRL